MHSASKVGLLVIIFVALVIGAFMIIQHRVFRPAMHTYFAEFADAGGLTTGTAVTMAGVQIGSVTKVELQDPRSALITMEIRPEIEIPAGSRAMIGASLLGFGERPLQIVPPAQIAGRLEPGSTMAGFKASPLDSFFPEGESTLRELNATLASLRNILDDEQLVASTRELIETGSRTLEQFGQLANRAQILAARTEGIMARAEPSLQAAMANASRAMQDIRAASLEARKLLADPALREEAMGIIESLNRTAVRAEELMASITQFVADPQLQQNAKNIAANTEQMTDSGTRIAANAEVIAQNSVVVSEKAVEFADRAIAIADEARATLERVQGFFGRLPSQGGIKPIELGMDLMRNMDAGRWRTDLSLAAGVPGFDSTIHLGLYDAFETNRINVQVARPLGGGSQYRYGIYASKPGVGVDYEIAPRLMLRGDFFDLNDPRLDVRLRYNITDSVIGWIGIDSALRSNSAVIGVGVRR
jgi:phospholipid/cholesterol/gamma-HCH transport system substrate-binding protein